MFNTCLDQYNFQIEQQDETMTKNFCLSINFGIFLKRKKKNHYRKLHKLTRRLFFLIMVFISLTLFFKIMFHIMNNVTIVTDA